MQLFRRKSTHERLELAVVRVLERDLRRTIPSLGVVEWTVTHQEGYHFRGIDIHCRITEREMVECDPAPFTEIQA